MCKQNNLEGRKNVMDINCILGWIGAILIAVMGIFFAVSIIKNCYDEGMDLLGVLFGITLLLIAGVCSMSIVYICITATKRENNIESALNKNYTGYTNYHHDDTNTFVYDDKKYSFDYDYDTNTLVVFNETGTVIDGTYVDGQKTNDDSKTDVNENVLETESESKAVDTSDNANKEDSAPVSENNSDLSRQIQSTILERYTDALITNYNASTLSGSFDSEGISYEFSWSDNLLEITEIENPNNVIYMKIAE